MGGMIPLKSEKKGKVMSLIKALSEKEPFVPGYRGPIAFNTLNMVTAPYPSLRFMWGTTRQVTMLQVVWHPDLPQGSGQQRGYR